jgi:hypothetical protein
MRVRLARTPTLVGLAFLGLIAWRVAVIPRIDSRLIGRWECVTPTTGREFITLYLRGNGRGHYAWQEGDNSCVTGYPWAVSGSTLQVHFHMESPRSTRDVDRMIDKIIFLFERSRMERRIERDYESWKLLSVKKNELRMRQQSTLQVLTFRRVSSGLDP